MSCRSVRLDLSLLRQAVDLERESGFASLEELARLGDFLEHAFYEHGSLRPVERGVEFRLLNPPLRMGAFRSARVAFDGRAVAPGDVFVEVEGASPRALSEVDLARPLTIPSGRPSTFTLQLDAPPRRLVHHAVRLELASVAIPPIVWIEFTDRLHGGLLS